MRREEFAVRDPFVLTDNGKYYILGTTGADPWAAGSTLCLYESNDLENLVKVGPMVRDGSLEGYKSIWAPELHKYRDKYYLIVSAYREDLGRGSFIFASDRIDGEFKMLTGKYVTPEGWGCLDATLLVWQDKPYLCFSNEWTTPISHDGDGSLFIAELSDDLTALVTEPKKIVSGKDCPISVEIVQGEYRGYVAEGPFLYEEDGKIVLLWSTFTNGGYSVLKNVSTTGVFGTYELEKTVFDQDGGHCMRFVDLNGEAWIVMHQPNVTPNERMILLKE